MIPTLADFNHNSNGTKDLIVKVLAGKGSLSAKKLHHNLTEDFHAKVSYQAVHKMLRAMADSKVLKKFENEYYLNPEWIQYICSFAESVQRRKDLPFSSEIPEAGPFNYYTPLSIKAIRFIPFSAGRFPRRLPNGFTIKQKSAEKVSFTWKNNDYILYSTGIGIQIVHEHERQFNTIEFLLDRRNTYEKILSLRTASSQELYEVMRKFNPSAQKKLSYVMSIHAVTPDPKIPKIYFNNLLKLVTERMILGIPANPKRTVGRKEIASAHSILKNLGKEEIECPSIYEMSVDPSCRILACWGNVVFSCAKERQEALAEQLIWIEADIEHLWFYFHMLKNELRKRLSGNDRKQLKKLYMQRKRCAELWDAFNDIGAVEDTQTIMLKEMLMKTSYLNKKYQELERMFSACTARKGNL